MMFLNRRYKSKTTGRPQNSQTSAVLLTNDEKYDKHHASQRVLLPCIIFSVLFILFLFSYPLHITVSSVPPQQIRGAIYPDSKSGGNTYIESIVNTSDVSKGIDETVSFSASQKNRDFLCQLGSPPWIQLLQDAKNSFLNFMEIYKRSPDKINDGGGSIFHYFALWCTIKALQPAVIIESGCHRGVGTWFLRQSAGTNTRIICVSPEVPTTYIDKQSDSLYFVGKKFQDFGKIDWRKELSLESLESVLIFFDDHQAGTERVHLARTLGFKHLIFDDNYLPGKGDNMSMKRICRGDSYQFLGVASKTFSNNFGREQMELTEKEFTELYKTMSQDVMTMAEFPPLWDGPNRFNIPDAQWRNVTLPPLFSENEGREIIPTSIDMDAESKRYTHIVYTQLADLE
uniref:Uncharacterized protein n=1 Tax=Ditylum brightwellii TaxID=49249 RepID=A0A7S1YV31_9STRA|mmetsp:Transcript_18345/g.27384  ORF Transcript_18345/g.27384 Transcript_18345/m.27384 type:complete len:400 (+) Transcript_18345:151-1350(+)